MPIRRRVFLKGLTCAPLAAGLIASSQRPADAKPKAPKQLDRVIGITTGSLNHQRETRELTALTLPAFVRDQLGMQLIDLNTRWLESFEKEYVRRVSSAVDEAGCYITNLKVNHPFGDLYSPREPERRKALDNAYRLIDVARELGARWIRFTVPKVPAGDEGEELLTAHRQLAMFGKPRGVQLLVENLGWLKSDADSIKRVVMAIGANVAACPDTGNWDDGIRYLGLTKSFPGAASCDFKVYDIDADGRHKKYDIRRCFDIAWRAGFRGPWAIEHWNEDTKAFARETVFLRDQLRQWMSES
ncbi:MAG: TIM barrel protein [Pirellulaceae bacterium]|nr:TIM barrel protein [Pirellulaceae bacterium]MDP7015405.1 TIM barrel protein [Pirellulaceae bacterium]